MCQCFCCMWENWRHVMSTSVKLDINRRSPLFFQLLKNFPITQCEKISTIHFCISGRSQVVVHLLKLMLVVELGASRRASENTLGACSWTYIFFRNLFSLILIYSLASEPNKQRRCILAFSENVDSIAPFISKFAEYANCRIWCMAGADGTHT